MAEPSSCATLPKLKASLPFGPNRFGPIWSVPMHGATASTPRLIASCTTGAARSTSHVVKMMFAPPPISFSAHAFATAGLLPCVSQVLICSWRPPTPPFSFHCATRNCAAASAGPSNGAIAPLLSNAQPIDDRRGLDASFVRAAAVAASATSAAATTIRMSPTRELRLLISSPPLPGGLLLLSSTARTTRVRVRASPPPAPPRTSRGTRFRTCRRRRRSRCRRSRPTRRRRARRGCAGTSAAPSPGSARSAQPRVGSRTSQTCTPTKRSHSAAMSSSTVGVFQRCQTSNWIPSAGGSPASRISSTASGIELTIVQSSPPSRWYGSSPIRSPCRSASAAIVRSPSTTMPRASSGSRPSAVPVRQTTPLGRNGASRSSDAQSASTRSAGSVGAAEERQRQDRRNGRNRRRRAEPALVEQLERLRVSTLRELQLPDADRRRARPRRRRGRRRRSSTAAS